MKSRIFILILLILIPQMALSSDDVLKDDLDVDGVVVRNIPKLPNEYDKCQCAKKWLSKAQKEDLIAMYSLANCYGLAPQLKNHKHHSDQYCFNKSDIYVDWMGAAATRGFAPAQYAYGMAWFYGTGVKKINKSLAIRWWAQAASQGLGIAYFSLGDVYEHGIERKIDLTKALHLYKEAEKLGYKESRERIKNIESIKNK